MPRTVESNHRKNYMNRNTTKPKPNSKKRSSKLRAGRRKPEKGNTENTRKQKSNGGCEPRRIGERRVPASSEPRLKTQPGEENVGNVARPRSAQEASVPFHRYAGWR